MKTNFLSLLAVAGLLSFTGCTSEDTANKEITQEEESSLGGLTSFVEADNATRTTADYDGSGLNFYWTEGDHLWVRNGGLTQDAHNTIDSELKSHPTKLNAVKRAEKAKFYFPGSYTAASYHVRYTGKNGDPEKVTIKAKQEQKVANDASHLGEDGDFAVATASKEQLSGKYYFTLDHKASYITFAHYTTQSALAGAKISKIRVYTGNTNDALAGTFKLNDNGTLSNPTATSNSVELNVPNFSIESSENYNANGVTMVVNPGTYSNVNIEYTLTATNGVTGTITKTYSSVTFAVGKNKKVKIDLQAQDYSTNGSFYYMWDARNGNHYWYGHLKPNGEPDLPVNYPKDNSDSRWHRENYALPSLKAIYSAKNCPNVNELLWYAMKGDPYWDNNQLWVSTGQVRKGGMWIKKKSKITGFDDQQYNGIDYRYSYQTNDYTSNDISQGKPSNINDYFYLPALGRYSTYQLQNLGVNGYYWSSTSSPKDPKAAYGLFLFSSSIGVYHYARKFGYPLFTAQ